MFKLISDWLNPPKLDPATLRLRNFCGHMQEISALEQQKRELNKKIDALYAIVLCGKY